MLKLQAKRTYLTLSPEQPIECSSPPQSEEAELSSGCGSPVHDVRTRPLMAMCRFSRHSVSSGLV